MENRLRPREWADGISVVLHDKNDVIAHLFGVRAADLLTARDA